MKIFDVIIEAIEAPLYNIGYQSIQDGIKQWLPETLKIVDQYTDKAQYRNQVRQIANNEYSERRGNLRDVQYQREYEVIVQDDNPGLHELLVKSFKQMLDTQLRQAAVGYIEAQFGKVERTVPKERYEEMKKRNLYFMQFVVVDINFTSKYKSGKPQTGGGYFNSSPRKGEFSDTFSQDIDWQNDIGFGIKIFTTENALWNAAVGILIEHLHTEHYGESEQYIAFDNLLKKILPTWVHEVVHLEQQTRRSILDKIYHKYDRGMSYTPQRKARPKYDQWNQKSDTTIKNIKGGVRGFPSRLSDMENAEMSEWIEYFGTADEIEAHAAGAAATIVHDLSQHSARDSGYHSPDYVQQELNNNIDAIIREIAKGYIPSDAGSLNQYYQHIRGEAMRYMRLNSSARDRDMNRDPRMLNKVNVGARKVWTIFLHKFVKHIQSYKKPVQSYNERDPRFRLAAPENKPNLPG